MYIAVTVLFLISEAIAAFMPPSWSGLAMAGMLISVVASCYLLLRELRISSLWQNNKS